MTRMKNRKRDLQEVRDSHIELAKEAIESGISSRKELAGHIGIKLSELSLLFKEEPDVYKLFCEVRRTIVDLASDNLYDVVADKEHPKNYDASKWVVANYKSDLDESLESKSDDGVEIEVSNGRKRKPTLIKFKKTNKE